MMEILIVVNVRIILWVIDVKEVISMISKNRFYSNDFSAEKSCSSPQCFNGGVCVNTAVSFKCICPIDYEGQRCDLSKPSRIQMNDLLFISRME